MTEKPKSNPLCLVKFPEIVLPAGFLYDTDVLGVRITVPPEDITVIPETCLADATPFINLVLSYLDSLARKFK